MPFYVFQITVGRRALMDIKEGRDIIRFVLYDEHIIVT